MYVQPSLSTYYLPIFFGLVKLWGKVFFSWLINVFLFRVFLNAGTGGYEEVVVSVGEELPRSSCPHIIDSIKVNIYIIVVISAPSILLL